MNIGYVPEEQLPFFRSLLLPDVLTALEQGQLLSILGLEEDGVACGAIAGGVTEEGDLEILSLYVSPDYRRRGGGRMLVDALLKQAAKAFGSGLVTADFNVTEEEHKTLLPFLEAMGFQQEDDQGENIYYITLQQLQASPFFKDLSGAPAKDILPFQKLRSEELLAAQHRAAKELVPLPEKPLTSPELDRRVSCAKVWDGKVLAFLAFDHAVADLNLACAWNGERTPNTIVSLLRAASGFIAQNYAPETVISMQAVNTASAELIQALLPEARPVSYTYLRFLPALAEEGGQ